MPTTYQISPCDVRVESATFGGTVNAKVNIGSRTYDVRIDSSGTHFTPLNPTLLDRVRDLFQQVFSQTPPDGHAECASMLADMAAECTRMDTKADDALRNAVTEVTESTTQSGTLRRKLENVAALHCEIKSAPTLAAKTSAYETFVAAFNQYVDHARNVGMAESYYSVMATRWDALSGMGVQSGKPRTGLDAGNPFGSLAKTAQVAQIAEYYGQQTEAAKPMFITSTDLQNRLDYFASRREGEGVANLAHIKRILENTTPGEASLPTEVSMTQSEIETIRTARSDLFEVVTQLREPPERIEEMIVEYERVVREALKAADSRTAAVLVTESDEFYNLQVNTMKGVNSVVQEIMDAIKTTKTTPAQTEDFYAELQKYVTDYGFSVNSYSKAIDFITGRGKPQAFGVAQHEAEKLEAIRNTRIDYLRLTEGLMEKMDRLVVKIEGAGAARMSVERAKGLVASMGDREEKLMNIRSNVANLKKVTAENLQLTVERGKAIDQLSEKADEIHSSAKDFHSAASELRAKKERGPAAAVAGQVVDMVGAKTILGGVGGAIGGVIGGAAAGPLGRVAGKAIGSSLAGVVGKSIDARRKEE